MLNTSLVSRDRENYRARIRPRKLQGFPRNASLNSTDPLIFQSNIRLKVRHTEHLTSSPHLRPLGKTCIISGKTRSKTILFRLWAGSFLWLRCSLRNRRKRGWGRRRRKREKKTSPYFLAPHTPPDTCYAG